MRGMLKRVAVLTVVVTACSSGGTPATTPPSVAAPTTSTTVAPSSSATTAEATTTTTTTDRVAEIEAIFQDLEERRLQALYDGDREAFKALFANDEYLSRSLVLFDLVEFVEYWAPPKVVVVSVLADDVDCIAAEVGTNYSETLAGGAETVGVEVLEFRDGTWGISYAGEDWACDGQHPLSS